MEILEAIRQEYSQQVFTCWELSDILKKCGYSEREISSIICEAVRSKRMGIVSFKKLKRRPSSEKLLVII